MDLFVIDTKGADSVDLNSSENEEESEQESIKTEEESEVEVSSPQKQHRGIVNDSSSSEDVEESDDSDTEGTSTRTPQRTEVVRPKPGSLSHAWKHGFKKTDEEKVTEVKEEDDECIIVPRGPSDDEDEDDNRIITEIPKLLAETKITTEVKKKKKKKKGDFDMSDGYIDFVKNRHGIVGTKASEALIEARKESIHKLLKEKSIAHTPGLEQLEAVPNPNISLRGAKKLRKEEREKTKGKQWYNLPATEVTEEVKHDLEVLQMRSVLDPKTFYKKNDLKVLPKYFQVGRVEDSAADFYHSRIPKKDRKRTIVDELLADADFQKRSKQKFKEIVQEKKQTETRAYRHARKLKRKKK